jgi:tetratricopeptide (TPR) repeat protein
MNRLAMLYAVLAAVPLLGACGQGSDRSGPDVERRDAALRAGLKHYESRSFEKARVEFRNALQADPDSAEALFQNGRASEKLGEFRESAGFYQGALDADPAHARARAALARAHLFAGLTDRAMEIVQEGLVRTPDDQHLLTVRGAIRAAMRDIPGAFQDAERAVALDPRDENAVLLLAGLYNTNARSDRARALLEKAVADHPDSRDVRLALADLYESLALVAESEQQLRALIEIEPQAPGHALSLARLLVKGERYDDAERALKDAIARYPSERDLRRALVDMLVTVRGPESAERQLRADADAAPTDAERAFALVQFYVSQQRRDDAEEVLREVIAREGTGQYGLVARTRLAAIRMQDGDAKSARALVDEVLAVNATDADALFVRGSLALGAGDPRAAIADLRVILRGQPEAAGALRLLGRAHNANGEVELAIESLRRAFDADPRDVGAALELAEVMIANGRAEQSRPLLASALKLSPADPAALALTFKAAVATRDVAGARSAADALLEAEPKSALAHLYDGMVDEASGQQVEAERAYRRALELSPTALEPMQALARMYVATERAPAALGVYDAFAARNATLVEPLLAKGELLLKLRRYGEAEATFSAALLRSPKSWIAHRGLAYAAGARGDVGAAESILKEGIAKVDQPQVLRADLADLYARSGRNDDAIRMLEAVVADAPQLDAAKSRLAVLLASHRTDAASLERAGALVAAFEMSDNAEFVESYGLVKLKRGDATGAVLALQRAVDMAPDSLSALYHLGLAQMAAGASDAARLSLQRVVDRGPQTGLYKDAKAAVERIAAR